MTTRNYDSAPTPRKLLLNASQRKYLVGRINSHYRKIHHREHVDPPEPPKIKAARKLIEDWEQKTYAAEKVREEAVDMALKSAVTKLNEALLFDSADNAIRKVAEFEETTADDYEPASPGCRSGSPNWDKEV